MSDLDDAIRNLRKMQEDRELLASAERSTKNLKAAMNEQAEKVWADVLNRPSPGTDLVIEAMMRGSAFRKVDKFGNAEIVAENTITPAEISKSRRIQIAQAIIALINDRWRSPTEAEIVSVLEKFPWTGAPLPVGGPLPVRSESPEEGLRRSIAELGKPEHAGHCFAVTRHTVEELPGGVTKIVAALREHADYEFRLHQDGLTDHFIIQRADAHGCFPIAAKNSQLLAWTDVTRNGVK